MEPGVWFHGGFGSHYLLNKSGPSRTFRDLAAVVLPPASSAITKYPYGTAGKTEFCYSEGRPSLPDMIWL